jgi:GNAT superfamily N-acetyltransferase
MNVTPLPWDSSHFGMSVARIETDNQSGLERSMTRCSLLGIRLAYLELPTTEPGLVNYAIRQHEFELIETRLTLSLDVIPELPASKLEVRAPGVSEIDEACDLVRGIQFPTRFAIDTRLDQDRVHEMYAGVIRQAFTRRPDDVLVAVSGDRVVGVTAFRSENMELAVHVQMATDPEFRGIGVARSLVAVMFDVVRGRGHKKMSSTTQVRNVSTIRVLENCGFRGSSSSHVLHRWFDEA